MNSVTVTGLQACYLTKMKGHSKVVAAENIGGDRTLVM